MVGLTILANGLGWVGLASFWANRAGLGWAGLGLAQLKRTGLQVFHLASADFSCLTIKAMGIFKEFPSNN